MSSRLEWMDGLLLPATLRRRFVNAKLSGDRLDEEVRSELTRRGTTARRRRWAASVRSRSRQLGARIVVPQDAGFPRNVLRLSDPPAALFIRGNLDELLQKPAVGVIGARRGSIEGRLHAERLGAALAAAGVTVVSGLAQGVDSAAHRGCLAARGAPIGVLGTGLDVVYPAGNVELQEAVAKHGCLVSEQPPGHGPRKHQFLARNRLIAALSGALVVVEAAERSGTFSTVDFALDLGIEVLAYPGPISTPQVAGCLQLIREGATLARGPADVLQCLGLEPDDEVAQGPLGLGAQPETPGQIARRLNQALGATLVALADLELEGRVRRLEGGRYAAVPAPARSRKRLPAKGPHD